MKLDPRIKALSDILTCFDIEEAKQYIGQKGYFTDDLYRFSDVLSCYHDTLTNVKDNDDDNYIFNDDDNHYWDLFIPESRLLIEKKKYRPFDSKTFEQHFDIGSVIEFRKKDEKNRIYKETIESTSKDYNLNEFYVEIGEYTYTLSDLFEDFELFENGEWKPFGVEE